MKRGAILCVLLTTFFLSTAAVVNADPVVITGGTASIAWDASSGSFTLSGDGLVATAGGTAGVGSAMGEGRGGQLVTLNGAIGPGQLWTGTIQLNGTTYSLPGFSGAVWGGGLTFTTTPFVLPISSEERNFTFSTPFTVAGTLMGFSSSAPDATRLFSVDVTGAGIASVMLRNHVIPDGSNLFTNRTSGVGYQFANPNANPTPEPSALWLMATALAAVARKLLSQGMA